RHTRFDCDWSSDVCSSDLHDSKPHGWRRWVYATNHKDIGTMYLIFACTMFFIGGFLAMLIRLELFQPGLQFWDPQLFNSFTTMRSEERRVGKGCRSC